MHYQAILFDFDGVLIDSEPLHYECWREIMGRVGVDLDRELYDSRIRGLSARVLLETLCALRVPPVPLEELEALYPVKNDLFRDKAFACDLMSPEVRTLLDELEGYALAVVSSARRTHLLPLLDRMKLRDRFQCIVGREDVSQVKPSPEPYLLAARRLGVERALVVEDSDAGEQSGRAAGFEVVRVDDYRRMPELLRARLT